MIGWARQKAGMRDNESKREPLIRLADVSKLDWLPKLNGKGIGLSTVHRWAANGLRGKKLRTVRFGGSLCTRESWLEEFFEELADPESQPSDRYETPSQRARAIAKAEKELEAEGII